MISALILVDDNAENSIAVASGSNSNLVTADIDNSLDAIENSEIVLMQLEIPIKTIEYAAQIAKSRGKMVILNPAPAPTEPLPLSILKNIDLSAFCPYFENCRKNLKNLKNGLLFIKFYAMIVFVPGCGSAWLERRLREAEVASSNLVTPIFYKAEFLQYEKYGRL